MPLFFVGENAGNEVKENTIQVCCEFSLVCLFSCGDFVINGLLQMQRMV